MSTTEPRQVQYLYDQVFSLVRGQIINGALRPGDRLPSLRRLSRQLKVSVATVMQGYNHLELQGLVEAREKSGYFVRNSIPDRVALPSPTKPRPVLADIRLSSMVQELLNMSRAPDVIQLGLANPAPVLLPAKALHRAMHRVSLRKPDLVTAYSAVEGEFELRRQIAYRASQLGHSVNPESIIITNGASEALALSLKSVTRTGDTVAVESPTYFLLLQLIEDLGLKALEVPSDPVTGLCIDAFEALLEQFDIRCLMCIPNFNNPYGSLMPDEAKQRLVDVVNRAGVTVIEDDVYGELHFGQHRPRPLRSFDETGKVVTCSSISKNLAPGLRVGWIISDTERRQMLSRKQAISISSSAVSQLTVVEYLADGGHDRHLRNLRRVLRRQVGQMRDGLARVLPRGTRISDPQGGIVLWVELPQEVDALQVVNLCMQRRVGVLPGRIFSPTGKYSNCIRVSCGEPWSDRIADGVACLGEVVDGLLRQS